MQVIETANVLAKIQAFNNRTVDEAVISTWHEILEPYELDDALRAVTDYFRHHREWIMPADILERVKEYQQARLATFRDSPRLSDADEKALRDAGGNWREETRALWSMAANGHISADQHAEYLDGNLTLEAITRKEISR